MLTETPPAPVATRAPSLDRFVEGLFAPLAWEATVRLGDPAMASRLVERVLHRVWDERDRFATPDALMRHATDAARGAITREADRRRDVTQFDDAGLALPAPGDLRLMSVEAVRRRLAEGRRPAPTPAAPMVAVGNPTAASAPMPTAAPAAPAAPMAPMAPISSATRDATNGATAGATPRPSGARPRPSAARPKLRLTGAVPVQAAPPARRWSPRLIGVAAGGVAVLLAVAWRVTHREPPLARAVAALADTTGLAKATARGQSADVAVPTLLTAHLGPDASLRASATFEAGPRALTVSGPVTLALATDSALPTVISTGAHRWMTHGVQGAVMTDGARLLVRVDSGALELLGDSIKGRVTAGNAASLDPVAGLAPLPPAERDAAFAWRTGRLVLARGPVRRATAAALQWFDLEVRFQPERTAADSIAVDVPLAGPDSLLTALAAPVNGTVEATGKKVTIRAGTKPAAKPAFAKPAPTVPGLFDKP
jgi:ferric-dicitrate binding protein FerR (iron transport regulator)